MKDVFVQKRVGSDGSLTLTDLPPDADVTVIVRPFNPTEAKALLQELRDSMRDHPFASMSREEVLAALRQTREEVARELYGD